MGVECIYTYIPRHPDLKKTNEVMPELFKPERTERERWIICRHLVEDNHIKNVPAATFLLYVLAAYLHKCVKEEEQNVESLIRLTDPTAIADTERLLEHMIRDTMSDEKDSYKWAYDAWAALDPAIRSQALLDVRFILFPTTLEEEKSRQLI